jgi:hypothetical protein
MGTASSSEHNLTPEQLDLRFLGDRLPFTDREIHDLYAAFQLFQTVENKQSFLVDWSSSIGAHGLVDVQDKVLPTSFGNALFEAAFCAEGDTTRYRVNHNRNGPSSATIATPTRPLLDEFTRRTRLEKFFDGLAKSSRRGPTIALTVLFHTLRVLETIESETNDTAANSPSDNASERVSAVTFVCITYLLARATIHLQQPETPVEERTTRNQLGVHALAHSIVAKARGQRKRYGLPDDCPYLLQDRVELQDILNWAEATAPMFGTNHCSSVDISIPFVDTNQATVYQHSFITVYFRQSPFLKAELPSNSLY